MYRNGLFICILLALFAIAGGCRQTPVDTVDAVKILVAEDGLYRLTLKQLQQAGLAAGALDATNLNLTQGEVQVPYHIDGQNLIFYGQESDSRYTAFRPYILRAGQPGALMREVPAVPGANASLQRVRRTLHLEENFEYISEADVAGDETPWFWQTIQTGASVPLEFTLPPVVDGAGELEISLYGLTRNPDADPDHSVALNLNGKEIGAITWDGQTLHEGGSELAPGTLQEGKNVLILDNLPEDYLDIMKLNWVRLIYHASPVASDDRLDFAGSKGNVALRGFSGKPLLFDIANPAAPKLLSDWLYDDEIAHVALADGWQVAAAGPKGFRTPADVTPLRESGWHDPAHQADLLIITTDELAPALEPLVAAREEQGLAVALIPVADIYDEFGAGAATPDSIKAFVTYAFEKWRSPRPRYLFLVGDATSDYRGYLADRPQDPVSPPANVIPPYLVPVNYSGETVSDARLADVDGDKRPELAVGRWPVDHVEEVRDLVQRTLAYEKGEAPRRAIFTADGTSSEFEHLTQRILNKSHFATDQAQLLVGPAAGEVAAAWNEGAWLLAYTGHGSLELWGKDNVFSTEAIDQLRPQNTPPIVLQLTCLSGLFAYPETTSLSEMMLTHEGGPVLTISATSLTLSSHQEPFATSLLQALQDREVLRIGDALQQAKESLDVSIAGLREISDTFGLLGDPSTLIVRPPEA